MRNKRFHIFLPTIVLLLLFCTTANAQGYRIFIATASEDKAEYVLNGWKWGEKIYMDTVKAAKGKIIFSGKRDIPCGEYAVSELSGRKLVEFIVPRKNRNFKISFVPQGKSYRVKKGNDENKLFSQFHNFINYGWEELSSAKDFTIRLDGFKEEASQKVPGSITDIILTNTLAPAQDAEELLRKFPFSDTIILNTKFVEDKVEQYLGMIQYNPNDTIIKYVNSLIANGGNRELQNRLGRCAYDFFYNSNIMGQEGVAVAIARDWFLNDKLDWPNKEGKFMLRTFVEFNKHSLIGMEAPELELTDTLGKVVPLHSLDAEYTIVYFYTDDCASCKKETPMLVDFVNGYEDGVLAVYAVYANDNLERWKEYINRELYIYNPFMEWVNVYDPEYSSGFQMLYNVIKTPQMFLLDKEMKIIGRGLDVKALKEILEKKNSERDKARALIEGFFAPLAGDTLQIQNGIDMFYNSSKGDVQLMKEFMEEIYNTLGRSGDNSLQQGAAYLAEKYILGLPELWRNNFLERVSSDITAYKMNRLGTIASDLELEMPDGSSINLSDVTTDYKVLYFYRPNCGVCGETTPKLAELYDRYRDLLDLEVVAVNLGAGYNEWINYISSIGVEWKNVRGTDGDSSDIYSNYYLKSIPTIYLLKDNVVIAKDIDYTELENTLKFIIQ